MTDLSIQPSMSTFKLPTNNFIDIHYTLYSHTIQKVTNAKYL